MFPNQMSPPLQKNPKTRNLVVGKVSFHAREIMNVSVQDNKNAQLTQSDDIFNIPKLIKPLSSEFDLISNLAINGSKISKVNYKIGGWVTHHITDFWAKNFTQ